MDIKSILSSIAEGILKPVKDIVSEIVVDKDKRNELIGKIDEMERGFTARMYELEIQDRTSARNREVEMAKAGRRDYFMYFVGLIGLASFCFSCYILAFRDIPTGNKELFINILGIIEGATISIFSYYFGTSKGSADKSDTIHTILGNGKK